MTLEELLADLDALGLRVERGTDGQPVLAGNVGVAGPRVMGGLKQWRQCLIDLYLTEPGNRIVALGPQGEVAEVLKTMLGTSIYGELRRLAGLDPGRELALEWWDGWRQRWIRFHSSPSITPQSSPDSKSAGRSRAGRTTSPAARPTTTAGQASLFG